jgi:spermidine synthase
MSERGAIRSAAGLLIGLATLSGIGGLVYEVLYLRMLTTQLGDMYYVHVWLLGTFLFGHGVGAWLAHRIRGWLPVTEIAIGGYALAFGSLLSFYAASPLSRSFASPVLQSAFLSALSLLTPAVCIGISIPLFSAYIETCRGKNDGFKISYLVYHVAAAASVLVTEFLVIRAFGIQRTLQCVALVNIGCGMALWLNRSRWSTAGTGPAGFGAERLPLRVAAAAALSGLAASLFVAFYLKATYNLFMPHRENFAVSTASLVLAIALGSALVLRDRPSFRRMLALACASLGIWVAWPVLADAYDVFQHASSGAQMLPVKLLFGLALAIPYVFFGATLPALLPEEHAIAQRSGLLLLISGTVNAVGFALYTLVLHPSLPVLSTPALVCLLSMLAIRMVGVGGWTRFDTARVVSGGVLCAVTAVQPDASVYLARHRNLINPSREILHFKSASDHVTLVRDPHWQRIFYNGFPSIVVSARGKPNAAEVIAGAHVIQCAPRRERAMVLGLGTGITGGTVATRFAHTDIVEINAGFFDLAPEIAHANFSVLTNPNAELHHDDGRRFLGGAHPRYDAIVNSIPSPTYFSAGKVYTREFYRLVKNALRRDGIFVTWLTFTNMSAAGGESMLATLADAFTYGQLLLLRAGYYVLVCSDVPVVRRGLYDEGLSSPVLDAVASLLPSQPPEVIWDALFLSPDIFPGIRTASIPRNTDDFPVLEFEIMRQVVTRDQPMLRNAFLVEPGRFQIGCGLENDPDAFLLQAAVIKTIHPHLYRAAFEPKIARLDPRPWP